MGKFPDYYCYEVRMQPASGEEIQDIAISLLSVWGFESFEQEEDLVMAYIRQDEALPEEDEIRVLLPEIISVQKVLIPGKNWNEEWENNFRPIGIAGKWWIRAGFHEPNPEYPYDMVINPEMSFGTGHHPTTRMVLEILAEHDLKGRSLIDVGCGSGILAVAAAMAGATWIAAIDNDPVCTDSTENNARINGISLQYIGDWPENSDIGTTQYVLANIQRNILLQQMPWYNSHLLHEGILVVSGIRPVDEDQIIASAEQQGLQHTLTRRSDDWSALAFYKPSAD